MSRPGCTIARLGLALALMQSVALPGAAAAQAELQGRVLADSGRRVVANAEISIPRLELRSVSDSTGRYRLQRIPRGDHLVVTRAVGLRPDSAVTEFDGDETLVRDLVLQRPMTSLDEVHVVGKSAPVVRGALAGYDARKERGIGHFLDREVFEEYHDKRLSDALSGKVPSLAIHRGRSRAWAASGRATTNAKCALCRVEKADMLDKYDIASGAPLACYVDVYLDGAAVYKSGGGQMPLFNLNSVNPREIEAVEVYTSTAQIPPEYVRMGGGCGVMLIWTRNSR